MQTSGLSILKVLADPISGRCSFILVWLGLHVNGVTPVVEFESLSNPLSGTILSIGLLYVEVLVFPVEVGQISSSVISIVQ